ncbi:hypothetical protein Q1695_011123 [Nippostrongylus brasiliensis]|nr:hypothetical protein Q1695_011123 [Nippostrongylus brasiliensis]
MSDGAEGDDDQGYHMDPDGQVHTVAVVLAIIIGFLCVVALIFLLRLLYFHAITASTEKSIALDLESLGEWPELRKGRRWRRRRRPIRRHRRRRAAVYYVPSEYEERCAPSKTKMVSLNIPKKPRELQESQVKLRVLEPPPEYRKAILKCDTIRVLGLLQPKRVNYMSWLETPPEKRQTWPSAMDLMTTLEKASRPSQSTPAMASNRLPTSISSMTGLEQKPPSKEPAPPQNVIKLSTIMVPRSAPPPQPPSASTSTPTLTQTLTQTVTQTQQPVAPPPAPRAESRLVTNQTQSSVSPRRRRSLSRMSGSQSLSQSTKK